MNAVILPIIFIISDLFLLFNTITLQITERAGSVKIKSIKAMRNILNEEITSKSNRNQNHPLNGWFAKAL